MQYLDFEKPIADLVQIEADLADKRSSFLWAQQVYFEARQQLGLVIGLDYEASQQLPHPHQSQ